MEGMHGKKACFMLETIYDLLSSKGPFTILEAESTRRDNENLIINY